MRNDARTPAASSAALVGQLDAELFRALCDPTRLALVSRLAVAAKPQTVTALTDCCGVHLSGVSRHLAQLRRAGLVRAEKHGREVRYSLDCARLTDNLRGLADALDACRASCCAPRKTGKRAIGER